MDALEKTRLLLAFYGPERMQAQASGETFVITAEMQEHAESFGFDRARADAAPAAGTDGDSAPRAARKGR